MTDLLVRYAHFIGIIVLSSMLVAEHILVREQVSAPEIKRIAFFDAIYGAAAMVVLVAGLSLWLWVGKPAEFYNSNPVFFTKLAAFVLMGLLSVYPTAFYLKHRNTSEVSIAVPKRIVWFIRMELLLLLVIPLLAVLMAHGYGAGS